MPSILFVCTGNQFRSPIAEAVFCQLLKEDKREGWTVSSAGTWTVPGQLPFQTTVELARSLGLELSGHLTRLVDAPMLESADVVLVMSASHKEAIEVEFPTARKKVHLLSQVLTGKVYDIPDPALAPDEAGTILRNLSALIRDRREAIYRLAGSASGS
jgi:protein-tyrosine phosphatase